MTNNKKVFFFVISYLRFWYGSLILLGVLSVVSIIYVLSEYGYSPDVGRMIFNTSFWVIEALAYIYISFQIVKSFKGSISNKNQVFFRIGVGTFLLFIMDVISLLRGGFQNHSEMATKKILEVIPAQSFLYSFYSKIYLYVPATLEFFEPKLGGVNLLIASIVCYVLSLQRSLD